jgi:hypothetical protein
MIASEAEIQPIQPAQFSVLYNLGYTLNFHICVERKSSNPNTGSRWKVSFFEKLQYTRQRTEHIPGNHDVLTSA